MQQFIVSFGPGAIFVLMVAEAAGIPIASEATMLLGGALAGGAVAGVHMDVALVIVAGTAGNLVGSYLAWTVGHYGGRAAVRRWGGQRLDAHLDRSIRWFDRHGAASVFFGRLVPVVRTFISLPAGLADMPPVRFGVYTFLGCLPWTAALAGVGYAIGENWRAAAHTLHSPAVVVATTAVLAAIAALVIGRRRNPHRPGKAHSTPIGQSHRSEHATQRQSSLSTASTERRWATHPGAGRR